MSSLNDFPESILHLIVFFCNDQQRLITLASLSKSLNTITTRYVLSTCSLDPTLLAAGTISIPKPVLNFDLWQKPWQTQLTLSVYQTLIPHFLAISFWIRKVRVVHLGFGLPFSLMLRDMGHLVGFLSRVGPQVLDQVYLDFRPADYGVLPRTRHDGIQPRTWEITIGKFMNLLVRGRVVVKDLRVLGGNGVAGILWPHETSSVSVADTTHPTVQNVAQPNPSPVPQSSSSRFKGLFTPFGHGVRKTHRRTQTLPTPQPRPHVLPDIPFIPLDLDFRSNDKLPDKFPPTGIFFADASQTTSPQTITSPAQPIKSKNPNEILQNLHLDSPILGLWTPSNSLDTCTYINQSSHTLTSLSLTNHNLSPQIWTSILTALHLPRLAALRLCSSRLIETKGADLPDWVGFLSRHGGSLQDVDVYGMDLIALCTGTGGGMIPGASPITVPPPFLPRLRRLCGHPALIAFVVSSHAQATSSSLSNHTSTTPTPEPFSSSLTSVTITSEAYGGSWPMHPAARIRQPDEVLRALKAISHWQQLQVQAQVQSASTPSTPNHANYLNLVLRFSPGDIVHKTWIQSYTSELKKYPPPSSLEGPPVIKIKSLTIECAYGASFDEHDLRENLPAFFGLFSPELEQVRVLDLGGIQRTPGSGATKSDFDEALKEAVGFGKAIEAFWAKRCPGVGKFEARNVWMVGDVQTPGARTMSTVRGEVEVSSEQVAISQ